MNKGKFIVVLVLVYLLALSSNLALAATPRPEKETFQSQDVGPVVELIADSGTVLPGQQFQVGLEAFNIADLYGVEISITFDPNLVEVVPTTVGTKTDAAVNPGSLFTPDSQSSGGWMNEYNNATGTISYVDSLVGEVSGSNTGFEDLGYITFKVKDNVQGNWELDFDPVIKLSDSLGQPITHEVWTTSAYIGNGLAVALEWDLSDGADLDLYMLVPADGEYGESEVCFYNRGDLDLHPYAKLVNDAGGSYGLEEIVFNQLLPGTYQIAVNNCGGYFNELSSGPVTLKIWDNGQVVTTRNLPTPTTSMWWHPLELVVTENAEHQMEYQINVIDELNNQDLWGNNYGPGIWLDTDWDDTGNLMVDGEVWNTIDPNYSVELYLNQQLIETVQMSQSAVDNDVYVFSTSITSENLDGGVNFIEAVYDFGDSTVSDVRTEYVNTEYIRDIATYDEVNSTYSGDLMLKGYNIPYSEDNITADLYWVDSDNASLVWVTDQLQFTWDSDKGYYSCLVEDVTFEDFGTYYLEFFNSGSTEPYLYGEFGLYPSPEITSSTYTTSDTATIAGYVAFYDFGYESVNLYSIDEVGNDVLIQSNIPVDGTGNFNIPNVNLQPGENRFVVRVVSEWSHSGYGFIIYYDTDPSSPDPYIELTSNRWNEYDVQQFPVTGYIENFENVTTSGTIDVYINDDAEPRSSIVVDGSGNFNDTISLDEGINFISLDYNFDGLITNSKFTNYYNTSNLYYHPFYDSSAETYSGDLLLRTDYITDPWVGDTSYATASVDVSVGELGFKDITVQSTTEGNATLFAVNGSINNIGEGIVTLAENDTVNIVLLDSDKNSLGLATVPVITDATAIEVPVYPMTPVYIDLMEVDHANQTTTHAGRYRMNWYGRSYEAPAANTPFSIGEHYYVQASDDNNNVLQHFNFDIRPKMVITSNSGDVTSPTDYITGYLAFFEQGGTLELFRWDPYTETWVSEVADVSYDTSKGNFTIPVTLQSGDNGFKIKFSYDYPNMHMGGSYSTSQWFYYEEASSTPSIDVSTNLWGESNTSPIEVSGTVTNPVPDYNQLNIFVNGTLHTAQLDAQGAFTTSISLDSGINVISLEYPYSSTEFVAQTFVKYYDMVPLHTIPTYDSTNEIYDGGLQLWINAADLPSGTTSVTGALSIVNPDTGQITPVEDLAFSLSNDSNGFVAEPSTTFARGPEYYIELLDQGSQPIGASWFHVHRHVVITSENLGGTVNTGTLTLEGYLAFVDSYDTFKVYVNSTAQDITNIDANGNFSVDITLESGVNDIVFELIDGGSSTTISTQVDYQVDAEAPVITMNGDAVVTVEAGSTYTDAGAAAYDTLDGDLTSSIITNNPVDTSTLGTYTVTYNVTDSDGNVAPQSTRTVHVVDTTKPVLTLLGQEIITIDVGESYTDAGATALDNYDGDITSQIAVDSSLDTSTAGSYTITYSVADSSGNQAVEVSRTVNVIDPAVTATVTVGSKTALLGETVSVPVTLTGLSEITGYGVTIQYDPAVLTPVPDGATNGDMVAGLLVYNPSLTINQVKVGVGSAQAGTDPGNTLCNIEFVVNDTATPDSITQLVLNEADVFAIYDETVTRVPVNLQGGTVEVVDVVYGDINNDGAVGLDDAISVLRNYVGTETFNYKQLKAADVNGDGQIGLDDAIDILRYYVGIIDNFGVSQTQ